MSNVNKCDDCKHGIRNNNTGKYCALKCRLTNDLFEPVEKTYNLLELEEGELYSCDENDGARYKRKDASLMFNNCGDTWEAVTWIYARKTFRKIKKKLTFKDLEVGDKVQDDHGWLGEVVAIRSGKIAVDGMGDMRTYTEKDIENWSKKQ